MSSGSLCVFPSFGGFGRPCLLLKLRATHHKKHQCMQTYCCATLLATKSNVVHKLSVVPFATLLYAILRSAVNRERVMLRYSVISYKPRTAVVCKHSTLHYDVLCCVVRPIDGSCCILIIGLQGLPTSALSAVSKEETHPGLTSPCIEPAKEKAVLGKTGHFTSWGSLQERDPYHMFISSELLFSALIRL